MNVETSGARSPDTVKKILAGTTMVTPRRPLTVSYGGAREVLVPGRSRLAVDHALVRANPTAFRACDASDHPTRDRLRSLSGTAARTTVRTATRGGAHRGGLSLPVGRFRLPTSGASGSPLPFRLPR